MGSKKRVRVIVVTISERGSPPDVETTSPVEVASTARSDNSSSILSAQAPAWGLLSHTESLFGLLGMFAHMQRSHHLRHFVASWYESRRRAVYMHEREGVGFPVRRLGKWKRVGCIMNSECVCARSVMMRVSEK